MSSWLLLPLLLLLPPLLLLLPLLLQTAGLAVYHVMCWYPWLPLVGFRLAVDLLYVVPHRTEP